MLSQQQQAKAEQLLRLAILFRIDRAGERLGVIANGEDEAYITHVLNRMDVAEDLDPDENAEFLRLTDQGRRALGEMVSVFDRTLSFNVFARVAVGMGLEGDLANHDWDPRFGLPDDPATDEFIDLRLAVLTFFAETHPDGPQEFDPYLVVFLQKLVDGELTGKNFWRRMRTGVVFAEIQAIVESAYQWRTIGSDEEESAIMMRGLFAAGMVELRKREGDSCGECEAPQALYEEEARKAGRTHDSCPCCKHTFGPLPDEDLLGGCPRCAANIYRGDRACRGCGAHVNVSLPPGTVDTSVVTETVTETDEVWSNGYGSYGYVPIGYYDPYCYPADLFVTGLVVGAILF